MKRHFVTGAAVGLVFFVVWQTLLVGNPSQVETVLGLVLSIALGAVVGRWLNRT